ncbi:MAG: hypothetical protein ACRDHZ_09745 [Ktedonobacteraceae bacterium]
MCLSGKSILQDTNTVTRDPSMYLDEIWQGYFADVSRVNQLEIAYGQPWKRRLGLIRLSLDNTTSFIGVNALLQIQQIPEYILIITIAHEITHYAHGFGSPLPRQYTHPHAHHVVQDELERRGLGEMMRLCDAWIDSAWFSFYDRQRGTGWVELPAVYRPARSRP